MKNPLTLGFSPCPNDTFMFQFASLLDRVLTRMVREAR